VCEKKRKVFVFSFYSQDAPPLRQRRQSRMRVLLVCACVLLASDGVTAFKPVARVPSSRRNFVSQALVGAAVTSAAAAPALAAEVVANPYAPNYVEKKKKGDEGGGFFDGLVNIVLSGGVFSLAAVALYYVFNIGKDIVVQQADAAAEREGQPRAPREQGPTVVDKDGFIVDKQPGEF
jgi:hypothetical protein